jgi:carbonic anhydrase
VRRSTWIGGLSAATAIVGAGRPAWAAEPASTQVVPPEVLMRELLEGNRRFVAGTLRNGDGIVERRAALTGTQAPFAAIVSCADSRVPPELVFDQGLGDLFVTRVAGNFAPDDILGSLEYAVEHLHTRLIVVLGHEGCGAVKAVYEAIKTKTPLPPHLDAIERALRPPIEPIVAAGGTLDEAVSANVKAVVAHIAAAQPVIAPAVEHRTARVVGAEYHLGTGEVRILARGV